MSALGLALIVLASCGPSGAEKKEKTAALEKRITDAQELHDEAQSLGADKLFAEDFETAAKKLADAQELIQGDKADKAGTRITSALSAFKDLIKRTGDLKKNQAAAGEAKKKVEKAIAKAKLDKVDVDAQEAFEEMDKRKATADAEYSDPKKVASAEKSYNRVLEMIQEAGGKARESRAMKEKAETELKIAKEKEAQAKEARADEFAADDMNRGQTAIRDADDAFKNGRYQDAFDGYRGAQNIYTEAKMRSNEAVEMKKGLVAEGSAEPKAGEGTPKDAPPPETVPPTDAKGVAKGSGEAQPKAEKGDKPVEPGEAPPRDPGPEGSVDDDTFLQQNIAKFTEGSKVDFTFDIGSGMYTVEYPFGDLLRKDVIIPRPFNPKHIEWKENIGGTTMGSKEAKGQEKSMGFSFGANTDGFFLFPVPFTEDVTLEYGANLGVMDSNGSLAVVLMSSRDGKTYYAANFGTIEWAMGGPPKPVRGPPSKEYQKSPNYWFSKTKTIGMKIEYKPLPKDAKRSQISIFYDTGDTEKPINLAPVPSRSGYAGFYWYRTKFVIRGLKISGKVDKQLAVKALREKIAAAEGGAGTGAAPKPKAEKKPAAGAVAGPAAPEEPEAAGAPEPKAAKDAKKKAANAKKDATEEGGDY